MIELDDEQAKKILDALSIGYENTCSACCPSRWKKLSPPLHSDDCLKVGAARWMLMDLASYADLRASGGIAR